MKKFLLTFLSVLLLSSASFAGWNLRQNSDGSADWVNGKGDSYDINSAYLTVRMADVSTASSVAIPIPITAARIAFVQAMLLEQITTAKVTFALWKMSNQTANTVVDEVTNRTGPRLGFTSESRTYAVTTFTPSFIYAQTPSSIPNAEAITNFFEQNQVLVIESFGESTVTAPAVFVIRVEPRRG